MATILKLTYANMMRKKFRTSLIILSVVLSIALMYTVMSMSASITKIFEQKIKKEVGNSEFMLLPKENSGDIYIPARKLEDQSNLAYQIPLVLAYGYTDMREDKIPVVLNGMSYQDYNTVYQVSYISKEAEEGLSGLQVLVGKQTAEEYQLELGDTLEVMIGGEKLSFHIHGMIDDRNNNLGYELGSLKMVADRSTIASILHLENEISAYYIKGSTGNDNNSLRNQLEEAYPQVQIKDVTDLSEYQQMINMLVSCLMLMALAVIMVSSFIIYSSFKVIVVERMPLIGTLRSIGATKKMTAWTLVGEAVFYGVISSLLGIGLGIGILSVTIRLIFKNFGISVENISYVDLNFILLASLAGILLVVGSAIVPILKMNQYSIRSIIFSEIKNEKHCSPGKTILGVVFLLAGFAIFHLAPLAYEMVLDVIGLLLIMTGASFVIPMISIILTGLLQLLFRPIMKDSLGVTTANIKNDKTMMNNIMLLAMGLGVILMINNFSSSVGVAVSDVYANGKADAVVFYNMDEEFISKVRKVEGIEHIYTTQEVENLEANEGTVELRTVQGIDGKGYTEYAWDEFSNDLTEEVLTEFHQQRSILVSKFTAKKYDLKKGDTLSIHFMDKTVPYRVIAVVPSIMDNGSVSYVYDRFLEEDANLNSSQSMYLNISDQYEIKGVMQKIKELLPYGILPIQTLEDMRSQNVKANDSIFFLMKSISIIAMFIGVIGILNNFTISFLSRKKLIATMRSLGLSKKRTVFTMLLEAFLCGCIGTLSGLMLGTILSQAMTYVIEAMGLPAEMLTIHGKEYVFVLVSGIVLSMISAIMPAFNMVKDNIVEGLRYE